MGRLRGALPGSVTGRFLSAVLALAVATALATVAQGAPADDPGVQKRRVDSSLDRLRDEHQDTSAKLRAAWDALQRTREALPGARARLASAEAEVVRAEQYNAEMAARLEVARANEARAQHELAETAARIKDTRTRVARFASQLYQEQGLGQLSVAMNATSPEEFASRVAMADTVMEVQNSSLGTLTAAQADATAQESHLEALRVEVTTAKRQAEAALAAAATARNSAASAQAALEDLAARQRRQSQVLTVRRGEERRDIASLEAQSRKLEKVLAARARAAKIRAAKERRAREAAARAAAKRAHRHYVPPPPQPSTGFRLSAPSSAYVSSEFGLRFHPILGYSRLHAGRDYAGACGSPVYAAAGGSVISRGWAGGYGNQIVVNHGIKRGVNLVTTYNHLSRMVGSGHVDRGEIIGYVGTTGLSTGCHLHFETRNDGNPVDPRSWF